MTYHSWMPELIILSARVHTGEPVDGGHQEAHCNIELGHNKIPHSAIFFITPEIIIILKL